MSQAESARPARLGAPAPGLVAEQRPGAGELLVWLMCIFLFFEPHWFAASLVGLRGVITRIPLMLLPPTAIVLAQRGRLQDLYWPFALFTLLHLATWPFAWNRGLALGGFKLMLVFFVVFSATVAVVNTPAKALRLYQLFLLSFVWYCLQGLPSGQVRWHTTLANQDAYGPLGVMAIGLGYYFALGSAPGRWRLLGYGVAGLGLLATVASFARGAFLGAVLVLVVIWLRSPRKLATLGWGLLGLALTALAAEILFPGGAFWAEMSTIWGEGGEGGTGRDRMVLWQDVGLRVFRESPIFGVGAFNVGVVASQIIPFGALEGRYANPATLYNKSLHNDYLQLLAEQGIVGFGVWLAMLFDFFGRLRRLRTPAARERWREGVAGRVDLLYLSLSLEAAMIAFLVGSVFYNQLYTHWFYSLTMFAVVLSRTTLPNEALSGPQARPTSRHPGGTPAGRSPGDGGGGPERSHQRSGRPTIRPARAPRY